MRRASEERLRTIWRTVAQEPGIRPGRVAHRLNIPRSSVTRALPGMEDAGLLLSEDAEGRLWAWKRDG